jgi:hypothetical protein
MAVTWLVYVVCHLPSWNTATVQLRSHKTSAVRVNTCLKQEVEIGVGINKLITNICWFWSPRCLRCRSIAAQFLGLWVWILHKAWMFVSCVCVLHWYQPPWWADRLFRGVLLCVHVCVHGRVWLCMI